MDAITSNKKAKVHVHEKGNGFEVYYYYYDSTGIRRQKSESFDSLEIANRRQTELQYEIDTGKFVNPNSITISKLFSQYLEYHCEKRKPSTYRSYKLDLVPNSVELRKS